MDETRRYALELLAETVGVLPIEVVDTRFIEGTEDEVVEMDLRIDEDDVEPWAFGIIYALGVLSFADARPRGVSGEEFVDEDEWSPIDMLRRRASRVRTRRRRPSVRGGAGRLRGMCNLSAFFTPQSTLHSLQVVPVIRPSNLSGVAYPLPLDPTPTSLEALLRKLPAGVRAELAWFPQEFRNEFVASGGSFRAAFSRCSSTSSRPRRYGSSAVAAAAHMDRRATGTCSSSCQTIC